MKIVVWELVGKARQIVTWARVGKAFRWLALIQFAIYEAILMAALVHSYTNYSPPWEATARFVSVYVIGIPAAAYLSWRALVWAAGSARRIMQKV